MLIICDHSHRVFSHTNVTPPAKGQRRCTEPKEDPLRLDYNAHNPVPSDEYYYYILIKWICR